MKREHLLYIFYTAWVGLVMGIAIWWTYLLISFGDSIKNEKWKRMIIWEGGTFIGLLFLLSVALFFLFLKDRKKTKSLQDFFSSLTHELKTPLASVRLQAEVMHNIIENKGDDSLHSLADRLIEDTEKLESQMDKILQLSRIERGGNLHPVEFNIISEIESLSKTKEIQIQISGDESPVLMDLFAFELIINNLIENTLKHTESNRAWISLSRNKDFIQMTYRDGGTFSGDLKKLSNMFYKYDSAKGSGIGLYLIKRLMKVSKGSLAIDLVEAQLVFKFNFPKGEMNVQA